MAPATFRQLAGLSTLHSSRRRRIGRVGGEQVVGKYLFTPQLSPLRAVEGYFAHDRGLLLDSFIPRMSAWDVGNMFMYTFY